MADRQYVFKVAEVVKVTDGDTYWLRVDVGFRGLLLINVRLWGYDCPEAHRGSEFEKAQAIQAQMAAEEWFRSTGGRDRLWIRTEKDPDNFGRWLGEVWWEYLDGSRLVLGEMLRAAKLASEWPTRWHEEFDTREAINEPNS